MKFLLSYVALMLLFFVVACSNNSPETTNTTETTSTDNNLTNNEASVSITEEIKPVVKPRFPAAAPSIHVGLTKQHQGPLFVNLVKPKQQAFFESEQGKGSRSDTLYGVLDLPFKDQELYVHQVVFNHPGGNSNQWCVTVIKNSETLIDEHVVSTQKLFALVPDKMKVGDKKINFTAIKADGTKETIELPYDGKKM